MLCQMMRKCLRLFPAIPMLLVAASGVAHAQSANEEVWQGTMEVEAGRKITMQIRARQEKGEWTAQLRSINPPGRLMTANELTLTDSEFRIKVKVDEITAEFIGTRDGDKAVGTWKQGGRELPLTLKRAPKETLVETWKGTLVAPGGELELQFRILDVEGGGQVVRFDSLSQEVTGLITEMTREDSKITFRIPQSRATFEGQLDESGNTVKGLWKQSGAELPVEFTRSVNQNQMRNKPKPPSRPQTPRPPFRYNTFDVKFRNVDDNVSLAGTLTYPKTGEKFPAVVLISGSGPQDRDETLFDHKPFLLIADQLTRAGIAVLRFDDRGVGESTGDFTTATSEDFANDVRAAVTFLKQNELIDASNVGLLGHSEGGLIAPMVAASDPDAIAFIVLLAGPGVNGFEILVDQGRRIAEAEGIPAEVIAQESALRDAVALAVRNAPEILDGEQIVDNAINQYVSQFPADQQESVRPSPEEAAAFQQLALPWFRFFLRYEPSSSLRAVRCPVLAINGERDLQVWHDTNLRAIAAALKAGGNTNFKAVRLPGLNHLLQRAKTGAVSEYNEITQTMAPEALDLMSNWIRKQVRQ